MRRPAAADAVAALVRRAVAATAIVAAVSLVACSGDASEPSATSATSTQRTETVPAPDTAPKPEADRQPLRRNRVPRARCPEEGSVPPCQTASGRILYVERVDPDGDGDAHFVLSSDDSITAPGISVIDVRRDLRPHPLPRPGDLLSAAGPVYRGSYGQHQIEAVAVRVLR